MTSQQGAGAPPQGQYRMLRDDDLRAYLAGLPALAARLGGSAAGWSITEVGDGNLNLVFIVKGPEGGLAVKQALPYVRLVGESWPLPLSRSHYEYLALTHQARLAPGLVRSSFIRMKHSPLLPWSSSSHISSCARVLWPEPSIRILSITSRRSWPDAGRDGLSHDRRGDEGGKRAAQLAAGF